MKSSVPALDGLLRPKRFVCFVVALALTGILVPRLGLVGPSRDAQMERREKAVLGPERFEKAMRLADRIAAERGFHKPESIAWDMAALRVARLTASEEKAVVDAAFRVYEHRLWSRLRLFPILPLFFGLMAAVHWPWGLAHEVIIEEFKRVYVPSFNELSEDYYILRSELGGSAISRTMLALKFKVRNEVLVVRSLAEVIKSLLMLVSGWNFWCRLLASF